MSDINYKLKTDFHRGALATIGAGESGNTKTVCASLSVTARADGDTILLLRVPSIARLHSTSTVYWDQLATSGAATLNIGVASVDNNLEKNLPDSLVTGLDVATGAGDKKIVTDHANYGKPLWEIAGLKEDPRGELDIFATVKSAVTNQVGDLTIELVYTLD